MLTGDLCLSVIPASQNDAGLFLRAAYLSGNYPAWRFPLLVGTEVLGMALCCFAVWVFYTQILPEHRRLRRLILASGAIYLTSAGAVHVLIGSLADWTSTLGPILGREETAARISAQYARVQPALLLSYAGMVALILVSFWAVWKKKTILP